MFSEATGGVDHCGTWEIYGDTSGDSTQIVWKFAEACNIGPRVGDSHLKASAASV